MSKILSKLTFCKKLPLDHNPWDGPSVPHHWHSSHAAVWLVTNLLIVLYGIVLYCISYCIILYCLLYLPLYHNPWAVPSTPHHWRSSHAAVSLVGTRPVHAARTLLTLVKIRHSEPTCGTCLMTNLTTVDHLLTTKMQKSFTFLLNSTEVYFKMVAKCTVLTNLAKKILWVISRFSRIVSTLGGLKEIQLSKQTNKMNRISEMNTIKQTPQNIKKIVS